MVSVAARAGVVIVGLFASGLLACNAPALRQSSNEPVRGAPQPGLPVYDGDAVIDPASGRVKAHWRIDFVRQGRQADTARLLLNGGLTVSSVSGPAVTDF